jgi:ketosteroid isomerase-like protein
MTVLLRRLACGGLLLALAACATPTTPGSSEVARVEAANAAFDAALTRRDMTAIDAAWAHDGTVTAIHPPSKTPAVGWEAVRKSWEGAIANFPELSVVLSEPQIRVSGSAAFVVGVESIRGRRPDGGQVEFLALTTNVYERRGDRWLLVHHQASRPPQ